MCVLRSGCWFKARATAQTPCGRALSRTHCKHLDLIQKKRTAVGEASTFIFCFWASTYLFLWFNKKHYFTNTTILWCPPHTHMHARWSTNLVHDAPVMCYHVTHSRAFFTRICAHQRKCVHVCSDPFELWKTQYLPNRDAAVQLLSLGAGGGAWTSD